MAFFLQCYTVKESISGMIFGPGDVFQIILGACQVGDRHPSLSSVSFGDGSDRADGFELGLGTTGPFYLTVKVLSPELSLSWRLKPPLTAHQWYEMKNDNSNSSALRVCSVYVWNYCLDSVKSKSVQACMCSQFFLHLLQCALWQDVSHRSHTDHDCSPHYNIRGYHSYGSHQIMAGQNNWLKLRGWRWWIYHDPNWERMGLKKIVLDSKL